jgi:hypothetical protein
VISLAALLTATSLKLKQIGERGLCHDEQKGLLGRHGCSSDYGNHGFWHVGGYLVERYVLTFKSLSQEVWGYRFAIGHSQLRYLFNTDFMNIRRLPIDTSCLLKIREYKGFGQIKT